MSRISINALNAAKAAGFDEAEAYYTESGRLELGMYEGRPEKFSKSKVVGLGIRGLKNGKTGSAYTERTDSDSIKTTAASAYENMMNTDSEDRTDFYNGGSYTKQELFNSSFSAASAEDKISLLESMDSEARKLTDRLYKIRYLLYGEAESAESIANTLGLSLSEKRSSAYIYISVIVSDGDKFRSGSSYQIAKDYSCFEPQRVAKEAVDEAISRTGAGPVASGSYQAIFRNDAFADLLGAFSLLFSADRAQKGMSKLKEKVGQKIGPEFLEIIDDPFLEGGAGNASFDGEGVPAKSKALVSNGVLMTLLHNLKTARKEGIESTGNAGRESFKSPVGITPFNLYIRPGITALDEGIRQMQKGLFITDLQGLHAGVNQISCDFSLSAQGFLIENGAVSRPVSDITVSGNFLDLLRDIQAVYSDLKFTLPSAGSFGAPSVEIGNIAVSGGDK